jgi:hypothetical protein
VWLARCRLLTTVLLAFPCHGLVRLDLCRLDPKILHGSLQCGAAAILRKTLCAISHCIVMVYLVYDRIDLQ